MVQRQTSKRPLQFLQESQRFLWVFELDLIQAQCLQTLQLRKRLGKYQLEWIPRETELLQIWKVRYRLDALDLIPIKLELLQLQERLCCLERHVGDLVAREGELLQLSQASNVLYL